MGGEMMGGCVFDGSISMRDFLIERRPYHRNCGCALHHRLKNGGCPHALNSSVSFLKARKWTDTCRLQIQAMSEFSAHAAPTSLLHDLSSGICADEVSICSEN
ncbi:hypothetical protein SDJN03_16416, partial [Cucurbita argyrosperma subsp. sororia]